MASFTGRRAPATQPISEMGTRAVMHGFPSMGKVTTPVRS